MFIFISKANFTMMIITNISYGNFSTQLIVISLPIIFPLRNSIFISIIKLIKRFTKIKNAGKKKLNFNFSDLKKYQIYNKQ